MEEDKNTKFFHSNMLVRNCLNKISVLVDANTWIENWDLTIGHIVEFFKNLYTKEKWYRSTLNKIWSSNLQVRRKQTDWKEVEEDKVRAAICSLRGHLGGC